MFKARSCLLPRSTVKCITCRTANRTTQHSPVIPSETLPLPSQLIKFKPAHGKVIGIYGPIELFVITTGVTKAVVCVILSVG